MSGCSVGLYDREDQHLLFKEWQIETTNDRLRAVLDPCLCPGNHVHGKSLGGGRLYLTANREFQTHAVGYARAGWHPVVSLPFSPVVFHRRSTAKLMQPMLCVTGGVRL